MSLSGTFMLVRRGDHVGFRLFGPFQLITGPDRTVVALRNKRARALLAYLSMQPDCLASREVLSNLLWPECPDANARHSLRQCLSSLRKDLDERTPTLLRVEQDSVGLDQNLFDADARTLLLVDPNADYAQLNAILKSFGAEFLAGFRINDEFSNWTSDLRRELAHKIDEILTRVDRDPDAAGDVLLSAIAAARVLVQADPFSDEYRRRLISLVAHAYGPGRALGE
jgi:DNA-binding SARP family transcriptional activator